MKLSAQWIRDFVELPSDDRRLAEDLTAIGLAVEGISGEGPNTVFEMEIGTNRPDAMNHYGVAREAAALYRVPLKPVETPAAEAAGNQSARNGPAEDRKSTRLNSSHLVISYAVFCLKKKKKSTTTHK